MKKLTKKILDQGYIKKHQIISLGARYREPVNSFTKGDAVDKVYNMPIEKAQILQRTYLVS